MMYLLRAWALLVLLCECSIVGGSRHLKLQTNQHNQLDHVTGEVQSLAPGGNNLTNQQLDPSKHDKQRNGIHSLSETKSASDQIRTTIPLWNERHHNTSNYESKKTSAEINKQKFTSLQGLQSGDENLGNTEGALATLQIPPSLGSFTPEDKFLCSPCNCYTTLNGSVIATCIVNLPLVVIISALRTDTVNLTIGSNSHINTFMARNFVNLTMLNSLTVSGNRRLWTVGNSSHRITEIPVTHLDLSHNKIRTIYDRSFKAMPLLLNLDLSCNNITQITSFTFQGLNRLQRLNLSHNNIQLLKNGSLDDIPDLRVLDLSSNIGLGYARPLMPVMFKYLVSLTHFYIDGNYNSGNSYPNELLVKLENLTELSIDLIGQGVILEPEMKSLKNLAVLDISCRNGQLSVPKNVSESFLENVPYLHIVRFNKCPIQHVDPNVYTHVKNLTKLQFSYTYPYSIFRALDGLEKLQNSSLTSLSLVGLLSNCPFIILSERHCQFLSKLLLEDLDLSENRIGFLEEGFLRGLPLTLKRLVLRGNKLVEPRLLLSKLYFLERLEVLDLGTYREEDANKQMDELLKRSEGSGGSLDTLLQDGNLEQASSYFVDQFHVAALCRQEFSNFSVFCLDQKYVTESCDKSFDPALICDRHVLQRGVSGSKTDVLLPPNLKYLLATRFLEMNISGVFDIIRASVNSSLEEVDVSRCALPKFPGIHTKIPHNIRAANFDGNYFKHLPRHLFVHKNTLRYLTLANNVLGNQFANGVKLFKGLKHLVYLDISMNMMFELPSNFFSGLDRIQVLIANTNKLHVVNTTFSHMPQLEYLDLKKNSIGWVSEHSRNDLDIIGTFHPLYIDLSSNPLRCTCEGLPVLTWIQTSNIHFVSMDFLRCHRDDGSPEDVGDLNDRVMSLRRRCLGNAVITVLSIASVLLVFVVIGFGLMYRYRWQLRYIRNIALSRMVGFQPRTPASSAYKFDAFIVYSDMSRQFALGDCLQELEVKRGHKLCVDDRDFMPGTYDVSAIVSAIQNSRKTVLILSPDFYDQQFSEYSVKMALMEEIYQKRKVLYLCVYQPLSHDEMYRSYDLLMVMKRNNYMEIPPETETSDEVRQDFWNQLSQIIGCASTTDLPSVVELAESP